jgi:hypothetical protein
VLFRSTLALNVGAPAVAAAASDAPPASSDAFCSNVARTEQDRPDLHDGRLIHVLYVLPQGASDDQLDTNGTLACSVLTQNLWMRGQSGLEWRWDTAVVDTTSPSDPNARVETLDVTFVRSTQPASALDSVAEVETELVLRGFDDRTKRYLTYVASGDGEGTCGDAWYPLTHHVGEVDGQYSQVYLDSAAGCGARDFGTPETGGGLSEAIAQQELMHNDGMTPIGAPHTCGNSVPPLGHVCTGPLFILPDVDPEGRDVMFPYVWYPLRDKVLDRGHDDYYDHGLPLAALETSPYLQAANAWGKPFVQPRDGGSPPAGPDAPGARTIEAAPNRTRVAPGSKVRIRGVIEGDQGCIAGQSVELQRVDVASGRELPALSATSGSHGTFTFTAKVRRATRFVATAPESGSCPSAGSAPFVVRVR